MNILKNADKNKCNIDLYHTVSTGIIVDVRQSDSSCTCIQYSVHTGIESRNIRH